MFNQVVVGVDGLQGGSDAIALAANLLGPKGELTLAHIYGGDPNSWSTSAEYEAARREHALVLLERAQQEAGMPAHLRWRRSTSVGQGLHEICEEAGSDLLVVGACGEGLLGRVVLGDNALYALNGAPCAVAIAPGGFAGAPSAMREIGVGYDGSPESERALSVARELAAQSGARLSAFQAVAIPMPTFAAGPLPLSDTISKFVDQARERIAALGGVEAHAAYGEAAEELAVYSASVDLLIVGSRGYGPLGRLIHRSTSRQVARSARCPLLVLPRGARPNESQGSEGDTAEVAAAVPS